MEKQPPVIDMFQYAIGNIVRGALIDLAFTAYVSTV
jgi:hypothetical protein